MSVEQLKAKSFPKWMRELDRFLPLRSQIYLYGNIYDSFCFPVNYARAANASQLQWPIVQDARHLLREYLRSEGFQIILIWDPVDGFELEATDATLTPANITSRLEGLPQELARRSLAEPWVLDDVLALFRALCNHKQQLSAGIIEHASRLTGDPAHLDERERSRFLRLLKAAREAAPFPELGRRNVLLLLCDKLNDLPAWLLVDNPLTRGIEVRRPDRAERQHFIDAHARRFHEGVPGEVPIETRELFADLTDGLMTRELENLVTLSRREKIPIGRLRSIVDLYRYGERENLWESLDAKRLARAEETLRARVIGQERAVQRCLEVIRRARLGLAAGDGRRGARPKGVLFFLGPTGTGKTEMARTLAELIFSDPEAVIRFDMSEYRDAASDVRLIGAPPGYVGYQEGGQLTGAVSARPFSILLFDEIDKAHPQIFDKFLQILDAGRLTDGKGRTVYFGETVIIFTSNHGVYQVGEDGRRTPVVDPKLHSYDAIDEILVGQIRQLFTARLGRPEILNRFGENFVAFDFIRPEAAMRILVKVLSELRQSLKEQRGFELVYEDAFVEGFRRAHCPETPADGGRGINNVVESRIRNGLATALSRAGITSLSGQRVRLTLSETELDEWKRPAVQFQLLSASRA